MKTKLSMEKLAVLVLGLSTFGMTACPGQPTYVNSANYCGNIYKLGKPLVDTSDAHTYTASFTFLYTLDGAVQAPQTLNAQVVDGVACGKITLNFMTDGKTLGVKGVEVKVVDELDNSLGRAGEENGSGGMDGSNTNYSRVGDFHLPDVSPPATNDGTTNTQSMKTKVQNFFSSSKAQSSKAMVESDTSTKSIAEPGSSDIIRDTGSSAKAR
jgi:hypothetical protein